MCTLKRHAFQNYAIFYACIGSSFKLVLIDVCFCVCSIWEQYQSFLQATFHNCTHSFAGCCNWSQQGWWTV